MGDSLSTSTPEEQNGRKPEVEKEVSPSLPPEFTEKYQLIGLIGKGAFGSVYKVRDLKTKAIYAVKHLEYNDNNRREVEIQAKLEDKHVVKIHDTVSLPQEKQLFVVMDCCEGGNLMQWIRRCRKHQMLNETVILQMFHEICKAVHSCHQKKVVHRDLKPENVLLDDRRRVKLADFGVARMLGRASVARSFCGTPPYMAPELFLSYIAGGTGGVDGYDNRCDVWSIGCILWDMANNKDKFVYQIGSNLGYNVSQASSASMGTREIRLLIDEDIPEEYVLTRRLLYQMLRKSAEDRVSLTELLMDRELMKKLENPMNGHWSDLYDKGIPPDSSDCA